MSESLEARFREFHDQPEWDEIAEPEIQDHPDGIEVVNANESVTKPVKLTLNSLGWEWHYKEDKRRTDNVNRNRVVITEGPSDE